LTVGFGPLPSTSPLDGLRQLIQIVSTESLVRFTDEGRPVPSLAKDWTISPDLHSVRLTLREGVTFHDGSVVDSDQIAASLNSSLPRVMGPAFPDVRSLAAASDRQLDFVFNEPSPFMLEALETTIQKPGAAGVGTGPYFSNGSLESGEMLANRQYYLGQPKIDRIVLKTYPTTRAAWADMLRGKVDMLYEVDVDALDSLQASKNVSLFKFTRRYQLMIVFNPASTKLGAARIRRTLNNAIDRESLIKEALGGFGEPSVSPIWIHHWAYPAGSSHFTFDPVQAVGQLPAPDKDGVRLRFTCLVPQGAAYERTALVVKRQLAQIGVDMDVQQVPLNELVSRLPKGEYEAALVEGISGPTMFRPYEWWHSGGSLNIGHWGNTLLDEALDRVRRSRSDAEYKAAVEAVHRVASVDPPAIFLAWGQRARAVSKRFLVPGEPGRDVLPTLRLWEPAPTDERATRN
jgi:peptide/nickel transport system substrate-binding protein